MLRKILFTTLIGIFSFSAIADEGMWLPQLLQSLNEEDMQAHGLQLTAADLYSINQSSLKDAIVSLGGFCTAEMISNEGLMLTNHHCGFDAIQTHSSVTNDYLEDGFWAMSRDAELENQGLTATFLISIESVTERVLAGFDTLNLSETERKAKIGEAIKEIVAETTEGNHFGAKVKSFFGGNEYYLLVYETFKDVRLVGAPPSSIGKFGGDTDNWMWPRHTGDFSLFRIYMAADGTPAEYSKENIPYKPKHFLPISLNGVDNGDYTMIYGFPGRTDRYLTSYGVQEAIEQSGPTIVDIRSEKLAIMKEAMDKSSKTKIQYAAKYAQTSNYWKYFIGQSKGLKRMRVYDKKREIEGTFRVWVASGDDKRQAKYGDALDLIEDAYFANRKINIPRTYLNEAVFQGAEILYFSFMMNNGFSALPKEDGKEKREQLKDIKNTAKDFYKNYNADVDEKLLSAMLEMYYFNIPKSQHPEIFQKIEKQRFGLKKLDFDYYAKKVFKKSVFASRAKFYDFLNNPSAKKIAKDPAHKTIMSIYNFYLANHYPKRKKIRADLEKGNRLFIAGLREMNPDKKYYPNANSTMRLTYGNVGDYQPGNAMQYDYYTTIDGIMEKEDATNEEFIVPAKLKQLYEIGDYGQYGDEEGNLRVNFISNNDITGGNSGSPVINAWGELVGTAFDGNWEAMSGDIAFENEVQRTISVDIRYTMFIIDKYAGATHLIDEMTIAPSHPKPLTAEEEEALKVEEEKKVQEEDPYIIVQKLDLVNFNGQEIPVMEMASFGSAFDMAVNQFGSASNILFSWKGNIYTTEKR
ncbi:MAG TPA: S46 family peptidase [Flavobacteriales bacterium]|nr:S46 family peptidase [Flavobacteriales bacterium]